MYFRNKTTDSSDIYIQTRIELTQLICGGEYFILKHNKDIRFHALGGYNFGTNTNPDAIVKDDQIVLSVGMQFNLDLVNLIKKIWHTSIKK